MIKPTRKNRRRAVELLGISFAVAVVFSITAAVTQEPEAMYIAGLAWIATVVSFILLVAYGVRHGGGSQTRIGRARFKGQSSDHH